MPKTGYVDMWQKVLRQMKKKVSRQVFETWFKNTSQVSFSGNTLVVEVPSDLYRQLFREKYSNQIQEIIENLGCSRVEVTYQIATVTEGDIGPLFRQDNLVEKGRSEIENPNFASSGMHIDDTYLKAQYTFDRFVVGSSNQFAHAAAQAVANNPSHSYNPLYLYGGVGLGKTHLMHAIGNYIKQTKPELKILYVQSEHFTNDVIFHIRFDKMPEFRRKYRNVDVLLIDDIQFIAGKDSTINEFFYTFNTLYNAQKQIVISSDQPPKMISNLEERIRSRFEWGLIADIQPPTIETKVAILQKKAEELKLKLQQDIALFMASKVKSNIRELEGSLLHLAARVSLTGAKIDMDAAREALRQYITEQEKLITIEMIQKEVAQYFDIKLSSLRSKGRTQEVALPRQIAMYLCRELTSHSLSEIGKKFGGRNHTTVIHACKKIESDLERDEDVKKKINLLRGMLES